MNIISYFCRSCVSLFSLYYLANFGYSIRLLVFFKERVVHECQRHGGEEGGSEAGREGGGEDIEEHYDEAVFGEARRNQVQQLDCLPELGWPRIPVRERALNLLDQSIQCT